MKTKFIFITLIFSLFPNIATANLGMKEVVFNGKIRCGVDLSSRNYVIRDENNEYHGIAVDICKSFAYAIFLKNDAYEIVDTNDFTIERNLNAKKIDVMIGATQILASKKADSKLVEVDVMLYEPQKLLVRKKEGATKISDYANSKICTTTDLKDIYYTKKYNDENNLSFILISFLTKNRTREAFMLRRCDVIVDSQTYLSSILQNNLKNDEGFEILDEYTYVKPIYIYMRNDNNKFQKSLFEVFNALKLAADLDITSNNIEITKSPQDEMLKSLLGDNPKTWESFDIQPTWLRLSIKEIGNYQEIFKNNLGENSEFKLDHEYNKSIKNGGLIKSQDFL